MPRRLLVTTMVLAAHATAFAAETPTARDKALPCRPTVSCTADLAAPGTLEVEAGWLTAKGDFGSTKNAPMLVKLTLTKLVQLQVGSNGPTFVEPSRALYFDDVLVGAKLHLTDQSKTGPSFAVTALVGIPTYNGLEAFVTGHASKDLGPIHADVNLGISEYQLDTTPVSQGFGAIALSTSLPPPFGVALETYYFTDAAPIPHDGGVRLALSATPKPWLVFDFGGDVGFFPSVRSFSLFFGMSIVPVVLWR